MSETFEVGDRCVFTVIKSWKEQDTRSGIVYNVVSPTLLIVEVDGSHKRFIVTTDSVISHTPKEEV